MSHVDILAKFLEMFPNHMSKLVMWEPYSENAVKVSTNDGAEITFAYFDDRNWTLSSGAVEMSIGGRA